MKIDTSGIEAERLIDLLAAEYDLGITSVAFLPVGEEAYGYVAADQQGERHFVRAQRSTDNSTLESIFAVINALHTKGRLRQVLSPHSTRRGTCTCRYNGYTVAVFPFIEGMTAYEAGLSEEGLNQTANLIAAVHTSGDLLASLTVPQETFGNPFEFPIRRALQAAGEPSRRANDYQRRVCRLLNDEQIDILTTLEMMRRLKVEARRLDPRRVLTHGDPNWANFLIGPQGSLHLTDWGEVAFGPPERDLFHFTGERFESFLRHYLAAVGPTELHESLFTFYAYRWTVQEIADYTTRILFRNTDPEEDRHAWDELAPYLPTGHREIRAGLREIGEILRRVTGG